MNKFFTWCSLFLFTVFTSGVVAQTYFTEDFESGTPDTNWFSFYAYAGEESIEADSMVTAPAILAGGGDFVGFLQDSNNTYSGSAVAINGSLELANYSIEADVYCYVDDPGGSAYTGLVIYADTTGGPGSYDFYKLRVDFDASNRINLSGLKTGSDYFPLFSVDFDSVDNPGLFPTANGWHKLKVEVNSQNPDSTAFWCYFDDNLLTGCPVYDTSSSRNTSGYFGVYTFQMDGVDGIPGYFDNIVVAQSPWTSVDNKLSNIPEGYYLDQNYPNPFNPETRISYQLNDNGFTSLTVYNLLGSEIKTLVNDEQPAGNYSVTWNGTDELGNKVPSGIYFYALRSGNFVATKKMILMK